MSAEAPSSIDLASEPDFQLGALRVRPSSREVEGRSERELLEPRVMQVLVALAHRRGQVVSRDVLIQECWAGRVVGEDAIQRCIAKVRRLAETHGGFSVETIPRVGYRLAETTRADGDLPVDPAARPGIGGVDDAGIDGAVPIGPSPSSHLSDRPRASAGNEANDIAKPRQPTRQTRQAVRIGVIAALLVLAVAITLFAMRSPPQKATSRSASVAVLPFADRNGDQSHLSAGITDELLSRLRRVDGLTVAGGEWMPRLLQEVGDPKSLGERLSVRHLLDGSVRREGERLRISARLTSIGDGHIIWSQDFDRQLNDVFAVQDEIALAVANALSVALNVGLQSTRYGGTNNFQAYDHYLRGLALRNNPQPQLGVDELEQAVTVDPRYARAWGELAIAWGTVARLATTVGAMDAALSKMDEASAKAESLAPETWFGHTPRGWYFLGRNDWVNADAAHLRAVALGDVPDPELHFMVHSFSIQVGRNIKARRSMERIFSLDPHYRGRQGQVNKMGVLMSLEEYAEAWRAYEASQREDPNFEAGREGLALWLAYADGNNDRAGEILHTLATRVAGLYAEVEKRADSKSAVLAYLRETVETPNQSRGRLTYAAFFAGHYGDPELAVKLLRRAFLGPGWAGQYLIWYPQLREARKTQAFKDFARDIGFVDMWRKSGDWGDYCRPLGAEDFECT